MPHEIAEISDDVCVEAAHRAICRQRCAFAGKPACWEGEDTWPNAQCKDPGCHAFACSAVSTLMNIGALTNV